MEESHVEDVNNTDVDKDQHNGDTNTLIQGIADDVASASSVDKVADGAGDGIDHDVASASSVDKQHSEVIQGVAGGAGDDHDVASASSVENDNVNTHDKDAMNGDPDSLDSLGRTQLYERGRLFEQKSMKDRALNCYLGCLTGLTEHNQFNNLPQCLHQIADIYFEKEEYEKAVHFIQAEKMYYETALVDITELQKQLKETQTETGGGDCNVDPHADKPEILKAREFENLSKMCLQQGNTQLALEYCGKATKIRQSVYGENHPETIKSLDLFTVIYADVGKKQYADAMKKFGIGGTGDENKPRKESGLRYRGNEHKRDTSEVRQDNTDIPTEEYEPTPIPDQQHQADDFVMTLLMMLVFFLITVFFALVITYVYCHYSPKSAMCASIRSELNYFYMRLKYHYYYYFKSSKVNTYM